MISSHELIALQRSAAMLCDGQTIPLAQEVIIGICDEILESRRMIERFGTDLRAIANGTAAR